MSFTDESTPNIVEKPGCIQAAIEVIGDKWTGLIVKELTQCPNTFSELELKLISISPRTLSQRLDKLEQEEIVEKSLYCERPPRYKYSLTTKGAELKEILTKMAEWGEKYSCSANSRHERI